MAGFRVPGLLGAEPADADADASSGGCVAGFSPGPLVDCPPDGATGLLRDHLEPDSAKQALDQRFTTDEKLLKLARSVPIAPVRDKAVFYCEDEGTERASAFIAANPSYTRLDELLLQSYDGMRLFNALTRTKRRWSDKEEVWWALSHRLANAASGVVHVFGPARLVEDRPLSEFLHKHTARPTYANTVFEKVEWPELEQNPKVTCVYYNGSIYEA